MKLVILGAPRTKKNHGKVIKRGKRIFHVQGDAGKAWEDSAVAQLYRQWAPMPLPCSVPMCVRAAVYREKNCGDLVGYLQAIGDALEKGGVIANDRLIASWDGSRLLKDAGNPRVELWIEPMEVKVDGS